MPSLRGGFNNKEESMTAIPEPEQSIASKIDKAHEQRQEPPRPHLGASQLGHPCDRWLWLSFRWAVIEKFPGRVLRLFRRGHMEEPTIVSDLRAIGIDIQNTGTRQAQVDFGSHVAGSIDGIIHSGVPEAPRKKHLAEFKTHAQKSFDDLKKNGVQKSKPIHWAQMQVYMLGKQVDRALYIAINKNTDEIYTERVQLDQKAAKQLVERGKRIALAERMPEPCPGASPDWYQCKYCPAHSFCNDNQLTDEVNCRTCAHVTPKADSTWHCARHDAGNIPVEFQRQGCECHVLHPDLVPWQRVESPNQWEAIYMINGREICNGEPDAKVFGSKELISNLDACLSDDEFIAEVRDRMSGRIVG